MGLFHDIFQEVFGSEPADNDAERDAKVDHDLERDYTGRDPIPTEPPDWAKDIPSPNRD